MQNIAILGAGITGLVAANRLAKQGHSVTLFDALDRLGGNQKNIDIGPYTYDIGTFIFPSFSPFFQEFPGAWQHYHHMNYAPLRITPKGNVHWYPFDGKAYFREQGPAGSALSVLSLLAGKVLNVRKRNVREYAEYYVGRRVYEQSGLKTYIERLFGLPDEQIDATFAAKRMSEIANVGSFRNILRHKILRQSRGAAFQWAIRPQSGFQTIFAEVRKALEPLPVQYQLGTRVTRIHGPAGKLSFETDQGNFGPFDRTLSTFPLPLLARLLGQDAGNNFPTARLYSLFYSHGGDLGVSSGTLYNFSPNGLWKRITILSHYYGQANGRDYFSVEVTRNPGDTESIDEIRQDFQDHIRSVGLMTGDLTYEGLEETPGAYPLYRAGARDAIEGAKARLTAAGVELMGRQGQFDYIPSTHVATEKATAYLETGRWEP